MAHMYWLTAALVAAWLALLISSRRMLKNTVAELRLEFQRQIDSLSAQVRDLKEAGGARSAAVATGKTDTSVAASAPAQVAVAQGADEITPETLAKIAETITALLGRKVQIRSVKVVPTTDAIANPWAQQGRAVIQASRNFASRRRER